MTTKGKEVAEIECFESRLGTHSFSEKIGDAAVLFSVLKLKDSVFVWVGSAKEPRLLNMCVAMKSPYESLPLTSKILGSQADVKSSSLASQLSRRLGKPVFISINVELDRFQLPELTKRLKEEITNYPEYF